MEIGVGRWVGGWGLWPLEGVVRGAACRYVAIRQVVGAG